MTESFKRALVRVVHLILAVPIAGYVYSPFDVLPSYAPATRYVFFPAIVLAGLWMWKGHSLKRLLSRSTQ